MGLRYDVSTSKLSKISSRDSYYSANQSTSLSKSRSTESSESSASTSSSIPGSPSILNSEDSIISLSQDETASIDKMKPLEAPEINEVNVIFIKYPDKCCPEGCAERCGCCDGMATTVIGKLFWVMRCSIYKLVEHKFFESFVILMIVASSLALVRDQYVTVTFCVLLKLGLVKLNEHREDGRHDN